MHAGGGGLVGCASPSPCQARGESAPSAWDYDGQLTSITQGSNTTSFVYDALGRRFSRTQGGTTTNFMAAGNAILLEKQGSSTTAAYTYGNALLRKDGECPLFDGLGSARPGPPPMP